MTHTAENGLRFPNSARSRSVFSAACITGFLIAYGILILAPAPIRAQLQPDNPEFTDPSRFPLSPQSRFIPCGNIVVNGIVQNPCNACHFIQLSQNILRFFVIAVATPAAAVLIAIGGAMMVFSPASPGQQSRGVKFIKNALWGLLLIFSAWVIIDSVMKLAGAKTIAGAQNTRPFQPWNVIECTVPEGLTRAPPFTLSSPLPRPTFIPPSQTAGCPTCVPLSVPFSERACRGSAGVETCTIDRTTAARLERLNQTLRENGRTSFWQVTEAYPPTRDHQNPCHRQGTCVDANLLGRARENPEDIIYFITEAKRAGLCPKYEVGTRERRDELIRARIPEANLEQPLGNWITGEHFSIYQQC